MWSASMIVGEAVAPTSLEEAPPASAARGGVPTLASDTGGEAALPSAAPRGEVVVRASSASASPRPVAQATSCGKGKMGHLALLVASSPACMAKTPRKGNNLQETT
jgi:hypothetical protein